MFKVKITWGNDNAISESIRIYKKATSFDRNSLPTVLAEITDLNILEYEDMNVNDGETWFYMLSTKLGEQEAFSECYQVDIEGAFDPTPFMGFWISSVHAKGSLALRQYDPTDMAQPTWQSNFGNTDGFVLNNYHYTEASLVNAGYNVPYHNIHKKIDGLKFNLSANTNTSGGYAGGDIRFMDAAFNDLFVLRIKKRAAGGVEVFIGSSISTLQLCAYAGSVPILNGILSFKNNVVSFVSASQSNNVLDFSFAVPDLANVENVYTQNCFVINPATNTGSVIYMIFECIGAA